MKAREKKLREMLGIKKDTPVCRSARLQEALSFAEFFPNTKIGVMESHDFHWGFRDIRKQEGIVSAKIIGADGNPHSKSGYKYIWIYAYSRKRCIKCGKLIKWGKSNPYAPVCNNCKYEGEES